MKKMGMRILIALIGLAQVGAVYPFVKIASPFATYFTCSAAEQEELDVRLLILVFEANCFNSFLSALWEGANPNASVEGWSALHIAALRGMKNYITILGDFGAHINVQNLEGETPLFVAAMQGHYSVVAELLSMKGLHANLPNNTGMTPLCIASAMGHKDIVRILLQAIVTRKMIGHQN